MAVDYNTLPHGGRPDQPSLDETLPIDIVRMLLDRGANPNLQLKLAIPYRATGNDRGLDGMLTVGTTPLLRAAKAQDAASIKLLLDHGAIVDLASNQGMTPIVAASGIGSSDRDSRGSYQATDIQDRTIVSSDLLLQHGGKVNAPAGRQRQRYLCRERRCGVGLVSRRFSWTRERRLTTRIQEAAALDYAMGQVATEP